jgi:hypothetical protein
MTDNSRVEEEPLDPLRRETGDFFNIETIEGASRS